jgi:hypothetical protein
MRHQSAQQKKIVGETMHEFKQGKLKSGSGDRVKNPRQAIAIGLKEAGASRSATKSENKRNLSHTVRKKAVSSRRASPRRKAA